MNSSGRPPWRAEGRRTEHDTWGAAAEERSDAACGGHPSLLARYLAKEVPFHLYLTALLLDTGRIKGS